MNHSIYIPSRKRVNNKTCKMLSSYGIPYKLFVESSEYEQYVLVHGKDSVVDIGGNDFGGVYHARNFIKNYSKEKGELYHWQIDDDISTIYEKNQGKNIKTNPNNAFDYGENLMKQYENISILGLSSGNFILARKKDYQVNTFAYTCVLINNLTPFEWEKNIEDDLDYNLQSLTNHWCSIRVNKFNFAWNNTGVLEGGYTDLYSDGKRLNRMKKTLTKWTIIPSIVKKNDTQFRLKTESIWSRFRKSPALKIREGEDILNGKWFD